MPMPWVSQIETHLDEAIKKVADISGFLSQPYATLEEYKKKYKLGLDQSNRALDHGDYHHKHDMHDDLLQQCNTLNTKIDLLLSSVKECKEKSIKNCLVFHDVKAVINHGRLKNGLFGLAREAVDNAVEKGATIPEGFYSEAYFAPPTVFRRSPSKSKSKSKSKSSKKTRKAQSN